jgi:hypothetical protein
VAQVTIYLPDELAERLRRDAKRSGRSLSAYIAELAERKPVRRKWPPGFERLYGAWRGTFPDIGELPVDEPEPLE